MKFDTGKPPINLVPSAAIVAAAQVFAFGAQKYGENNWRRDLNNFPLSRHYASIQRQLLEENGMTEMIITVEYIDMSNCKDSTVGAFEDACISFWNPLLNFGE